MIHPGGREHVTLLSILCGQEWWWDSDLESEIIFHENGTGLLVARREFCLFIVAEFRWSVRNQEALDQVDTSNHHSNPHVLGKFEIEIHLTKNRPPKLGRVDTVDFLMNEALLTDEAFAPRNFIVSIEKGIFNTVDDARLKNRRRVAPKYSCRLHFDHSPYPSRDKWKDPTGAPDALKFWEWKDFYAGQLEEPASCSEKTSVFDAIRRFLREIRG